MGTCDNLDGTCDVALGEAAQGDAARVERPHGQLRARLTDGLGGDDAGGQTLFDELAGAHVHAVAHGTDAGRVVARQRRADAHRVDAGVLEVRRDLAGDDLVLLDDDTLGVARVDDLLPRDAAEDGVAERDFDGLALVDRLLGDAVERAAVDAVDDDVLSDVAELAGEVAGVGGLEGGVGQALTGAVC